MSVMNETPFWKTLQNSALPQIETFLQKQEKFCVSAVSRFTAGIVDAIWAVEKDSAISALLLYSKRALFPVFAFPTEELSGKLSIDGLPLPVSFAQLLRNDRFYASQGLGKDMILLEAALGKNGVIPISSFDYELRHLAGNGQGDAANGKLKEEAGELKIRKAVLADADALFPLQAAYEREEVMPPGAQFEPAVSRKILEHLIAGNMLLTAELKGRIVGKIAINALSWNYLQIGGVYVLPEYRSLGIAQAMTASLIRELSPLNKQFTLYVKKTNLPALRVYDKLGFVKTADFRISYF